ncbi:MAG: peptidoglycan-binding protein [Paracoccaceae bacterium]
MRLISVISACLFLCAPSAMAQSVGLLVGNSSYDTLPDFDRGQRISRAVNDLSDAGMDVTYLEDADQSDLTDALETFGQQVVQSESVLIVLSGRFLTSATETYFLPVDADVGPLATLHTRMLPLSSVFALMAQKPGKSVVVLATDGNDTTFGRDLALGFTTLDIPQGVTVIRGGARRTTDLLEDHLAQPGRPFIGAARQKSLEVMGFAPDTLVFLEGRTPPPQSADVRIEDIRDWRAASSANTVDAYEGYLETHPNGTFVDMAESRIAALVDTPEAKAERAEQALDLNRDARRDIQRDLSLLGFNTRGIDGIFGRGTRGAISEWQRAERFDATGFLTREQITLLNEQAQRRAVELEAEAEKRRQEQLAADVQFWNQTGAGADEAGLRAYLKRFPDGEFSELASERLGVIEDRKRARANRQDRERWDQAVSQNTANAYERYLVESPNGAFREEAQARIVAFQRDAQFSKAARQEAAMNLSTGTRRIIESRLNGLGLRPGPIDGVFDNDTRRAIRRYQSARKLPETGYVSDPMMVQLMADTVRQIFR